MCSAFFLFISLFLGLSPSRLTAQWVTSYQMNSSRGSERVSGTPWGSVKFRYTICRAVFSSYSSPKPQPPSSSPPLRWEELRWFFLLQALMVPSLLPSPHPPDTTSSYQHFHSFTHSPYSAKTLHNTIYSALGLSIRYPRCMGFEKMCLLVSTYF